MDNEFINKLERTFNDIISEIDAKNIKYKSNDIKGITALGYYSKVIEGVKAIIILLKENNIESAIQPIYRSILEALVDLNNIKNIDGYIDYLFYLDCDNRFKATKKNFFSELFMEQDVVKIKEDRNQLKKFIKAQYGDKFFNKGKINTSIKFKFELSKNIDTYDSLYWLLCSDSHNNMSSIEKNYYTTIDEYSIITPFKVMDIEKQQVICLVVENFLKDSQRIIYDILDLKK